MVEEVGVPGENHRPWASNWYALSLAAASRVHLFCKLQSRARTYAVLVIGLYELLGNPTAKLIEPITGLDCMSKTSNTNQEHPTFDHLGSPRFYGGFHVAHHILNFDFIVQ